MRPQVRPAYQPPGWGAAYDHGWVRTSDLLRVEQVFHQLNYVIKLQNLGCHPLTPLGKGDPRDSDVQP
jgi:hypothetical protein